MTGRLQRQFGQALLDLGALDLEDRGLRTGTLAAAFAGESSQFGKLNGGQVDFQFRDLALEEGIGQQRAASVGAFG